MGLLDDEVEGDKTGGRHDLGTVLDQHDQGRQQHLGTVVESVAKHL